MPKIRTRRAAAKRFKVTSSGKVKRERANANHIFTKKSPKRKRNLRQTTMVTKVDMGRINRMLVK